MVVVGCLGSPYGVHGWLKLYSYTQPIDNILNYPQWYLQTETGWQLITSVETQTQPHGKYIRVKIAGCDSPEQARLYTNALIAVTRDQLPELADGEYYWSDLEGLSVVNTRGVALGQVDHLFSTGANDVMVVKGERERLLPYIKNVVLEVDLVQKKMVVEWDEDF